jgi:allophanate hydrolase subunit 2
MNSQIEAMDPIPLRMANWLVDKPSYAAAIESTLGGPTITIEQEMKIAICGAELEIYLSEKITSSSQSIKVQAQDIQTVKRLVQGARAYLAFSTTPKCERVLNSYATHLTGHLGGFSGRQDHFYPEQSTARPYYFANNEIPSRRFN